MDWKKVFVAMFIVYAIVSLTLVGVGLCLPICSPLWLPARYALGATIFSLMLVLSAPEMFARFCPGCKRIRMGTEAQIRGNVYEWTCPKCGRQCRVTRSP
jgi:hypothetical protein